MKVMNGLNAQIEKILMRNLFITIPFYAFVVARQWTRYGLVETVTFISSGGRFELASLHSFFNSIIRVGEFHCKAGSFVLLVCMNGCLSVGKKVNIPSMGILLHVLGCC